MQRDNIRYESTIASATDSLDGLIKETHPVTTNVIDSDKIERVMNLTSALMLNLLDYEKSLTTRTAGALYFRARAEDKLRDLLTYKSQGLIAPLGSRGEHTEGGVRKPGTAQIVLKEIEARGKLSAEEIANDLWGKTRKYENDPEMRSPHAYPALTIGNKAFLIYDQVYGTSPPLSDVLTVLNNRDLWVGKGLARWGSEEKVIHRVTREIGEILIGRHTGSLVHYALNERGIPTSEEEIRMSYLNRMIDIPRILADKRLTRDETEDMLWIAATNIVFKNEVFPKESIIARRDAVWTNSLMAIENRLNKKLTPELLIYAFMDGDKVNRERTEASYRAIDFHQGQTTLFEELAKILVAPEIRGQPLNLTVLAAVEEAKIKITKYTKLDLNEVTPRRVLLIDGYRALRKMGFSGSIYPQQAAQEYYNFRELGDIKTKEELWERLDKFKDDLAFCASIAYENFFALTFALAAKKKPNRDGRIVGLQKIVRRLEQPNYGVTATDITKSGLSLEKDRPSRYLGLLEHVPTTEMMRHSQHIAASLVIASFLARFRSSKEVKNGRIRKS